MARLASIEKAGFYPLPQSITPYIMAMITAPHGGRILDPCAGRGVALTELAFELGLEPYANEIHADRAERTREKLQKLQEDDAFARSLKHRDEDMIIRTIKSDVQRLDASTKSFNLIYLNPPYDSDRDSGRLEYLFLKRSTHWLQEDGLLVYVVPQTALRHHRTVKYLSAWYDDIKILRFPPDTFKHFKQHIVFGVKRGRKGSYDPEWVAAVKDLGQGQREADRLDVYGEQHISQYTLPKITRLTNFHFRSEWVRPEDAKREAELAGVQTLEEFDHHLFPRREELRGFQPLMPLKKGHLAGLIAAGFLDNHILQDEETGEKMLIKGRSYKRTRVEEETVQKEDGGKKVKQTEVEYSVTDITALTPSGRYREITPDELPEFLQRWLHQLTNAVTERYQPLYQFDQGKYGDRIGDRGSLFPVQKHIACAVSKRLENHRDAHIVGEMGTGKTRTASAVIPAIKARRTIVMCPPHLYKKWIRELQLVNPEAKIMHLKTITDVRRWFELDETKKPLVGVMKFTSARAGSGWNAAYNYWQLFTDEEWEEWRQYQRDREAGRFVTIDPDLKEKIEMVKQWRAISTQRGVRCPTSGQTLMDSDDLPVPLEEVAKESRKFHVVVEGEEYEHSKERSRYCPLWQNTRWSLDTGDGSYKRFESNVKATREILERRADPNVKYAATKMPASEPDMWAKYPLASYILDHHKGEVDLLIADEIHELKGRYSDRGYALGRLSTAAKKTLGLTGTIFGGKSSTIFWIFYRTSNDMRQAYTDDSETGPRRMKKSDWVKDYGMMQYIITRHYDKHGQQSGNRKGGKRSVEAPGSSPKMLPWLLDRAAFMSLNDLGFPLPDYQEIPTLVDLAPDQEMQMEMIDRTLGQEMRERIARGDMSLLSNYLQTNLSVPDAPWREEVIIDSATKDRDDMPPRVIAKIPPLSDDHYWPKEQKIIELIKNEVSNGRRCVLFCQQTNTRDIQPKWKKMLENEGLTPAILRVGASKREEWINKQSKRGTNVIITHPGKVKTGLDILDYPTFIWMGIEYSVYTVLQASRRSWRIGQNKPVKVYFFAYRDTLQEAALQLIAKKSAAVIRVNGDVIQTNSVAAMGGGSIHDDLAKMIASDEKAVDRDNDLQALFQQVNMAGQDSEEYMGVEVPYEDEPDPIVTPAINELGDEEEQETEDDYVVLDREQPTEKAKSSQSTRLVFGMTATENKRKEEPRGKPKQMTLFDTLG